MIRGLTLTIFLSVILFSCSKSNEDKLVGSWIENEDGWIMTFNSDKTLLVSHPSGDEMGAWKLNEATMEICLGESIETLDNCATITSIDDNRLCVEDQAEIICFNKYK